MMVSKVIGVRADYRLHLGFIDNYVKALSVKSAVTVYFEKKGLSIRCWVTNTARFGH
jgi:hypothetical protein